MAIIQDGRPKTFVSEGTLQALEAIYQKMRAPELSESDASLIGDSLR
jgi:hypothetical protein